MKKGIPIDILDIKKTVRDDIKKCISKFQTLEETDKF